LVNVLLGMTLPLKEISPLSLQLGNTNFQSSILSIQFARQLNQIGNFCF